jgi:hypothetical protein
MGLWGYPDPAIPPSADTDIAVFYEGHGQPPPPMRSIGILSSWASDTPLSALGFDWSRIVAVEIDEPYMSTLQNQLGGDQRPNPCSSSQRMAVVNNTMQVLAGRAAELAALNPKARFWVNFTDHEGDWMRDTVCPVPLNQPNIDVISIDRYGVPFSPTVEIYYDWFAVHPATPHQQLALIPGTFHRTGDDSPQSAATSASYLQAYFDYANNANQSCNLSLGSRGVTGNYDRCRVWIVLGFLTGDFTQDGDLYMGEQDPASAPIATTWRAELALPLRPGLAHQPTAVQMLSTILPPLLNQ